MRMLEVKWHYGANEAVKSEALCILSHTCSKDLWSNSHPHPKLECLVLCYLQAFCSINISVSNTLIYSITHLLPKNLLGCFCLRNVPKAEVYALIELNP